MRLLCAILFFWSAGGCQNIRPAPDVATARELETSQLYGAAYRYLHDYESEFDTVFVVGQTTAYEERWEGPEAMNPLNNVSAELATSFLRANAASARLPRPPKIPRRVVVLLDSTSAASPETVTHGIVQFSQPGFSATRDSALVLVNRYCGSLCGSFDMVLLVREQGQWKGVRLVWSALSASPESIGLDARAI
jgi:hypothetical protein